MAIVVLPKLTGSQTADTAATPNTIPLRDAGGGLTVSALLAGAIQGIVNTYTSAHTVNGSTGSTPETFVNGNAASGAITFTLPLAANVPGQIVIAKKIDSSANAVTLAAAGADTIDGVASKSTTTQYATIRVYSDGTVWWTF